MIAIKTKAIVTTVLITPVSNGSKNAKIKMNAIIPIATSMILFVIDFLVSLLINYERPFIFFIEDFASPLKLFTDAYKSPFIDLIAVAAAIIYSCA